MQHRFVITPLFFLVLLLVVPSLCCADITATFSAGGTSDAPIINEVDAWPGRKGDGWADAWQVRQASGTTVAAAADKKARSLTISMDAPGGAGKIAAVSRAYSDGRDLDVLVPHRISFFFRLDSSLGPDDTVTIYAAPGTSTVSSAYVSWCLIGSAREGWRLVDGNGDGTVARLVPVGGQLTPNTRWRISIDINPTAAVWNAQITDTSIGTDGKTESLRSPKLKFRTASGEMPRPCLTFGGQSKAAGNANVNHVTLGSAIRFTVGEITLSPLPEPK